MRSLSTWDQSSGNNEYHANESNNQTEPIYNSSINAVASSSHQLETQEIIPPEELIDSIASVSTSENNNYIEEGIYQQEDEDGDEMYTGGDSFSGADQPTLEQIQRVYYTKGLQMLDSLQLIDLSPLANWKLSSSKQEFSLSQLRDDSSDSYWQSDGSNGSNNINATNGNAITNNQLANPHSITIQFSKKVSLERISIFTNFSADESYTPSKIRILAGTSDDWDLSEVCTVNFNKPIGWSHIIFNAIRDDGVLKCFTVKLVILANHQDGKDTRIRAVRCFGKKSTAVKPPVKDVAPPSLVGDILKDLNLTSGFSNASGLSLNNQIVQNLSDNPISFTHKSSIDLIDDGDDDIRDDDSDKETNKILNNVSEVIGFNSGFQSVELSSISSIR
ncbi:DEHA2F26400p [Debaryomyces hansenii CBS767]|uniref:DEHA2F26400p n=1 Tax=Debaryomyces hansenii (strain ATCC 36239 / CBS 767 / BCRC 21394 / JCM 1990 / NBRC 0083 / IGC 2968) TaxID=284592 RepID=W0TYU2_DEBHA|nr:DEHA2F26400p [Debaryomyces hansenii CBS767]CAG89911.2 DEHA2F26400p [Debaryomyces hansenii CBS767]|eukprot:XP_002770905.1 DEHA2F26400p [Debaryomyces hansenii CBS767]